MRILFSILLFISFAIRPAIEISTVLYYQLNINTIVEKYCVNKERPRLNCNGKCYLMSQLNTKTQSPSESTDSTLITEAFLPLFFQETTVKIENTNSLITESVQNWKLQCFHIKNVSKDIDHPPQYHIS
ncbi:hypothetical protein [Aquimarina sp. I32.4]|uniref:hypothetical protein n=1 Tax=Aquimarina sp. I32.4 TaxID=2053903 RepID=UPI0011AF385D|nr:hypothetical protein [Aquimarina sp. I32.4]